MVNLKRPNFHFADTENSRHLVFWVLLSSFKSLKVTKAQNSSFTCKCERKQRLRLVVKVLWAGCYLADESPEDHWIPASSALSNGSVAHIFPIAGSFLK